MALPVDVPQLGIFQGKKGDQGIKGDTGTLAFLDAVSVPADQPASATMVQDGRGEGAIVEVPRGLPGVNALENDAAVAAYVAATDSDTGQALNDLLALSSGVNQGIVYPERTAFGALTFEALQAAADEAAVTGRVLRAAGELTTDQTLMLACSTDLGGLTITYTGPGVGVQVGVPSNVTHRLGLHLPRVVHGSKLPDGSGWDAVAGTTGVVLLNLYACPYVIVPYVRGFETGLRVEGRNAGNSYNTLFVGHLENNKRNLFLTGVGSGWSNQNTYIGGRYSHNNNEGVLVAGVEQVLMDHTSTHKPDNNLFLNPSLEGAVPQYVLSVAGQENMFINGRYESASDMTVRWLDGALRNQILNGWRSYLLKEEFGVTTGTNTIHSAIVRHRMSGTAPVFQLANTSFDRPALGVYESGAHTQGADPVSAWNIVLNATRGIELKNRTDSFARVRVASQLARIYFGDGASEPTASFGTNGADLAVYGANLVFPTSDTDIGRESSGRPRYIRAGSAIQPGNGTTAARPNPAEAGRGSMYYDINLGKPIWVNNAATGWVDATGAAV